MDVPIIERASSLLRDAPHKTLTLARLHALLGAAAPALTVLADLLDVHPAFVVTVTVDPFQGLPLAGPGHVLEDYRRALRAGSPDDVRIRLRGAPPAVRTDAFGLLATSLNQLNGATGLPGIADRIAEAHVEYGVLARSAPDHPA